MTEVNLEEPKRGGYRKKRKLPYGTQRLLEVLWKKHGGVRALEKKTGIAAQKFVHWRLLGKVSLKMCGKVSRSLGVPVDALNFEEVGELLAGNAYDWEDMAAIGEKDRKYILAGKPPKKFKP